MISKYLFVYLGFFISFIKKKNQNIFGYLFLLNFSRLLRKQVEIRSRFEEKQFFCQTLKKNIYMYIFAALKHYFSVVSNLRLCRSNSCASAHARGNSYIYSYTCL